MNVTEQAVHFDCHGQQLLGVASLPQQPSDLGMVVVVGGPQYRAGSHRQFVQLARRVAATGVPVLRFDVRGMGDSEGDQRGFEHAGADIGAAIDALQQAAPTVRRVVLWGLCDGASAALLYLGDRPGDARIAGLSLLNPWVRSPATLARTQVKHYYTQRLLQVEFWRKLLSGQVARHALSDLGRTVVSALRGSRSASAAPSNATYTQRMAQQWQEFGGSILLVLSGNDYTAKEFSEAWSTDPAWQQVALRPGPHRVDVPGADHTFSDRDARLQMESQCLQWLANLAQAAPPGAPHPSPLSQRTPAHA